MPVLELRDVALRRAHDSAECRERGVPILPPDINESHLSFSVEPNKGVRFGLSAIKGLGESAVNALVAARVQLGGRIPSLHALCEVADLRIVNKRVLEALVKAGACDSMAGHVGQTVPACAEGYGEPDKARPATVRALRARLFAAVDAACDYGTRTQRDKDLGQTQLFGGDEDSSTGWSSGTTLSETSAWTEIEQLQHEKDALGLYWSGHPTDRYAQALRAYGAKSTAELVGRKDIDRNDPAAEGLNGTPGAVPPSAGPQNGNGQRAGEDITIGGIVSAVRPLKTRKGDRMCVLTLDDAQGSLEVVVFPDAFKQHGHLAEEGRMVLVKGRCERDDESARVLVSEIAPLEIITERLASSVAITLSAPPHDRDTFMQLWDVLMQHKGDRRVAIELCDPDHHLRVTLDINAQIRVRPSERLVAEVERICGAGSVSLR